MLQIKNNELRKRRKLRIRHRLKIANKAQRKRVYFRISNKHMYAQLIDDVQGKTLLTISTLSPELQKVSKKPNKAGATQLSYAFAETSQSMLKPDESLILDRGNHLFHGRMKCFAEGLIEKGIKFSKLG